MKIELHREFLHTNTDALLLLAVSGGRDSVALLHVLLESGYKNLVLCHLNHGLRGEASDSDARFVEELGEKLNLPTEIKHEDVGNWMSEKNESLELAARNARHEFFQKCSRKHRCHTVLLGHHMDDHAETILFNLLRGSTDLKGIPFYTTHEIGDEQLVFIRPFINTRRSEIDEYVRKRAIAYCDDESNQELSCVRNRIRHEVMPLLESVMQRDITPALCRASDYQTEQCEAVLSYINSLGLEDPQGRLFLPKLEELHNAFIRRVIFEYLKKHQIKDVNSEMVERCCVLLSDHETAKVNLTEGKFFRRREKRLFIQ